MAVQPSKHPPLFECTTAEQIAIHSPYLAYLHKYITIPYKQDDKDFKRVKNIPIANLISSFV